MRPIAYKAAFLLVCGCVAGTVALHGQVFSGIELTESRLTAFVKQMRQLQPGRHSLDDVVQLVGAPHAKSDDGTHQLWHYSFLVSPDDEAAEKSSIEQQIAQLESERSRLRDRQFKISAEAFRQRSDALFAEDDRIGAAIDQIESRLEPLETRRREMLFQHRNLQVGCVVAIDQNGRLAAVEVQKLTAEGSELMYSIGSSDESETVATANAAPAESASQPGPQAADSAPEAPALGQIYFNTKDKAFYGWNGNSWDKLSGGGAQRN